MGERMEKLGKKKLAAGIFGAVAVGIGMCIYFSGSGGFEDEENKGMPPIEGMRQDVIAVSGLTAAGMTEEKYELDFLETALYVEESYLSIGDAVEEGTPVFKISDETLSGAREELERAATEAGLAYRQGVIDYEIQKLEAEGTYEKADINREYAQAEYESALLQAKKNVTDLAGQVEEAQALYEEYKAASEGDYYKDYYGLEELKETYYDNFTFLMELYEKWEIEKLQDSQSSHAGTGAGNTGGSGNTGVMESIGTWEEAGAQENMGARENIGIQEEAGIRENIGTQENIGAQENMGTREDIGVIGGGEQAGNAFYQEDSAKVSVYEMMEELVEKNGEEYEAALEGYEKDTKMAAASLDLARSNLAKLQAELAEAQLAYEKQVIQRKAEYETAVAESGNARNVYETTVQKLDEELETLKEEMEETEENRKLFEDTVGDGYFYTGSAGVVVMNMVRRGSYLTPESVLLAYSDPETVTVAASVGQEAIAEVEIGDRAYVSVNGYGEYQGTVISIDPVSSSGSRSSASYTVNIELEGDVSGLESNLTAYVYLGMDSVPEERMGGKKESLDEHMEKEMEK